LHAHHPVCVPKRQIGLVEDAEHGQAVDVRQVGKELGVRYVLEGSLQASGEKVRVTAELVDAATGAHV